MRATEYTLPCCHVYRGMPPTPGTIEVSHGYGVEMGEELRHAAAGEPVSFFFSSRRRHTRFDCDWSSDVCSSDLSVPVHRIASSFLTAPELLGVLRRLERRGKYETAHRAKQRVGQVVRYAIATGRAERTSGRRGRTPIGATGLRPPRRAPRRGMVRGRSPRSAQRPLSDNAVTAALRRMGYTGEQMSWYGFRAMPSTLLNEQGYAPDVIELQLAHQDRNEVRAAYNCARRLNERRKNDAGVGELSRRAPAGR